MMKIVFMGTPEFAAVTLRSLIRSEHEVIAVFTRPDKPNKRGNKITFTPVKTLANEHHIPVYQPVSFKSEEVLGVLSGLNPDCACVAAYGRILPKEALMLPKYGCINVHASLLPQYRGAAPINRCIMEGAEKSGVTIMQMDDGIDTGDMLMRDEVDIPVSMTASELHDVLAEKGAALLLKALDELERGALTGVKQEEARSSYAATLNKDDCKIDFSKPAREVYNQIRGLADYPCAYTYAGGKRLKIYRAVIAAEADINAEAGEIINPADFTAACGNGTAIRFTELQPEGGKRMKTEEFLKGNVLKTQRLNGNGEPC